MNRRDLLVIGTSAAAASVTGHLIACASENKEQPATKEKPAAAPQKSSGADQHKHHTTHRHGTFAMAAANCQVAGDACIAHCLEMFATGDTSMAACAAAVNSMLAVCNMLGTLAASNSPHLKTAATLCLAVCTDCKRECDKHLKHAECKACADACETMIVEAKKLAA